MNVEFDFHLRIVVSIVIVDSLWFLAYRNLGIGIKIMISFNLSLI